MGHRLLLGSGGILSRVAQQYSEQPGSLQVVTTDSAVASTLREQGITVEQCEQIDRRTLESCDRPDIVGVFDEHPPRGLIQTAKSVFSDIHVVVYSGWQDGTERGTASSTAGGAETISVPLQQVADRVIDPKDVIAEYVTERAGDPGQRMRQLQRVLRGIDNLAVVTHDNPDPDALASALALKRIATAAGCSIQVCYYGEITHQENRAFVNVLDMDLRNLDPADDLSEFDGIALVDHSRPGVNDQLPSDIQVDIVIDHHPPRSPVDARFVDLRSNVGATSTLLVDYLDRFNISFDEEIATALLFGIHVDTDGFSREISQEDFTAGARLVPKANFSMLDRIESPSINAQTFETIADAIANRHVDGETLLSCVGALAERDALAQAADRLLNLEEITTVLVYGIKDDRILISARARGADIDLGEALREAFGQIGSAGGHVDMAGAQIDLGVLGSVDDRDESLRTIVEEIVTGRFFDVLETKPGAPPGSSYPTEAEIDVEYRGDGDEQSERSRPAESDRREDSDAE